jgi:predicted nucleic acid-binding protein
LRFADSSFWYAANITRDAHHAEARALVASGLGRVLSTNHVVVETWTLLRRRANYETAVAFADDMSRLPGLEIVHVDEETEKDAWRWLRRHDEREYSFVDAISFAMMRRRRIREALAFDSDFSAAGFVEVRVS